MNFINIILTALLFFGVGAGWYTIFAKQWLTTRDINPDTFNPQDNKYWKEPWPYIATMVVLLILSAVVEYIVIATNTKGFINGALLGFILWLGFSISTLIVHSSYEDKKIGYIVFNGAYFLIGIVLTAAIHATNR